MGSGRQRIGRLRDGSCSNDDGCDVVMLAAGGRECRNNRAIGAAPPPKYVDSKILEYVVR